MIRGVTLRLYQEEAAELMTTRGKALLSLTMGAGKTVVSIYSIEELADSGAVRSGLVVVPSSLKYQWQTEIKRFTGLNALVIDGTKAQRERLYKVSRKYRYVVLNYEAVVNDWAVVRDLDFDFIVADEVSYLKSFTSKRSKRLKFLAKRSPITFGLTGQPIENKAEELFSIMEFIDPEVLGDFRVFDKTFIVRDVWGKAERYRNLDKLRERMKDVMYRKTRDEIKDQFPKVQTTMLPFALSSREQALYDRAASYTAECLRAAMATFGEGFNLDRVYGKARDDNGQSAQMKGDIMSGILAMRFICDDPLLLRRSGEMFLSSKGKEGSKLGASWLQSGVLDNLPEVSTKRKALVDLVEEILAEDPKNKVVIFSTFKGLVSAVQDDTAHLADSVQFTGDMNAYQKREAQQQFRTNPKTRLFLSSDAGGYGVDLPEANYLISCDLPWSTGAMEQREARIIRVSSLEHWDHVDVISILAQDSIEMRMYQMIEQKRGISQAFIDGKHDSQGVFTPTLGTLGQFLSNYA